MFLETINDYMTLSIDVLKKIENSIITLNEEDQKTLNNNFTQSGKSKKSPKITLDDSNQELPSGKEKVEIDNVEDIVDD
tara:strand:+ start:1153 stop:1389 length:237 start_codon:yes stop_codon:yes gene_type:complete